MKIDYGQRYHQFTNRYDLVKLSIKPIVKIFNEIFWDWLLGDADSAAANIVLLADKDEDLYSEFICTALYQSKKTRQVKYRKLIKLLDELENLIMLWKLEN